MGTLIKVFGQLADIIGSDELQMQDISDTGSLREKLVSEFPELGNYPFVVAVGKKVVNGNQKINTGDEVALLPPFAGG